MVQRIVAVLLALFSGMLGPGSPGCRAAKTSVSRQEDPDLVIMFYDSFDRPYETLAVGSIEANQRDLGGVEIMSVGAGDHLWTIDDADDPYELQNWWMFRFRHYMEGIQEEYRRRGSEDFLVLIADAWDVYVTSSLNSDSLSELKRRFLQDFSEFRIVISSQIYCCNPWSLRDIARKDWDEMYEHSGGVQTINKYINAGTYMGYASSLLQMAEEMQVW